MCYTRHSWSRAEEGNRHNISRPQTPQPVAAYCPRNTVLPQGAPGAHSLPDTFQWPHNSSCAVHRLQGILLEPTHTTDRCAIMACKHADTPVLTPALLNHGPANYLMAPMKVAMPQAAGEKPLLEDNKQPSCWTDKHQR